MGAVILGGAHGSLAVARSLGRRGVPVVHVNHDHPIVGLSRYMRRKFRWEGPDAPDALERLLEIGRDAGLQGWVLFAGGDPEVRFAARHRAALSHFFRVTTPPWEITGSPTTSASSIDMRRRSGWTAPALRAAKPRRARLAGHPFSAGAEARGLWAAERADDGEMLEGRDER